MASQPPQPDAIVTLRAERNDGTWTLLMVGNSETATLGAGKVGSGIMFPVALIDQFSARQANS